MSFSRTVAWVCLCCVSLVVAASCTSQKDTEAYVPSQPGVVQPDAAGPLLAEAAACSQLRNAESKARADLGCAAPTRACPDYIRPAGGADCFQYFEGSIDSCASLYASFTACADFDAHPCLVSAEAHCDDGPSAEGGAGGTSGSAAAAGEGGAGGAAGTPSDAGSAGGPLEVDAGSGGA